MFRLAVLACFFPLVLWLAWRDVPSWAVVCTWTLAFAFLALASRGRSTLKCPYCGKGVKIGATHCHHCGRQVVGEPPQAT